MNMLYNILMRFYEHNENNRLNTEHSDKNWNRYLEGY
jgi:hypothetical protein